MAVNVNTIPSINIPFTDKNGRINPIWHDFLRSFVTSSVDGTISESSPATSVTAGPGLIGGGQGDVTLAVGAGSGIAVNADTVAVDIVNQQYYKPTGEDELLLVDVSDNNTIKKAKVRDVGGAPGGLNTNIQYNSAETFGGDSNFTYNGTTVTLGAMSTDGVNFASANNAGTSPFVFTVPVGSASYHYKFLQSGSGSSDMPVLFGSSLASTSVTIDNNINSGGSTTTNSSLVFARSGASKWSIGLTGSASGSTFTLGTTGLNVNNVFTVDATNFFFTLNKSMMRTITASITASTTRTQGQGALTADINEISVCANLNDTVTLPTAVAARHCLVINNGAQTLQVFPASGDNLGAGLNTSTTIASGSRKWFVAYDTTNWEPVI